MHTSITVSPIPLSIPRRECLLSKIVVIACEAPSISKLSQPPILLMTTIIPEKLSQPIEIDPT
jgi:hypothetical protein